MQRFYTRPTIKSYTDGQLYEAIGPAQASYSVELWFQQISSDQAMLSSRSGEVQMVDEVPKQKIYRYNAIV